MNKLRYMPPRARNILVKNESCLFVTSNQEVDITSGEESGWEFKQD